MNDAFDGRTCIGLYIVHGGAFVRTHYARIWCVSDSTMNMQVYDAGNTIGDVDNFIHNTKLNAFPVDSNNAATLVYVTQTFCSLNLLGNFFRPFYKVNNIFLGCFEK